MLLDFLCCYAFDTLNHNIISIRLNEIDIHINITVGLCLLFHLEPLR